MKQKIAENSKGTISTSGFMRMVLLTIMVVFNPAPGHSSENPWEVTVGGGGFVSPVYYGSDEFYAVPVPHFKAAYTERNFSYSFSLLDGIGVTYRDEEKGFLGSINVNGGEERDSEEYTALGMSMDHSDKVKRLLQGSPSVKTNVRTEIMLGYVTRFGIFGTSLEYHPTTREGEKERSYDGFLSSLSYLLPFPVSEKLTVTGMLALGFMDQDYAEAWYSVEKPTRELEAFKADAGLRNLQLVVQADYMIQEHIGITFHAGNSFLLMDAGDSPYTTSKYQLTSGLYGFYTF